MKHCGTCIYRNYETTIEPCKDCTNWSAWENRNKHINLWMIGCLILIVVIFIIPNIFMADLQEQDAQIASLQAQVEAPQTIEQPYTMITNLSSSMYLNRIPAKFDNAQPWTDVNGVSGFDVTIDGTHYRYVEGHIEGSQLTLYAPYLYVEENIFE